MHILIHQSALEHVEGHGFVKRDRCQRVSVNIVEVEETKTGGRGGVVFNVYNQGCKPVQQFIPFEKFSFA